MGPRGPLLFCWHAADDLSDVGHPPEMVIADAALLAEVSSVGRGKIRPVLTWPTALRQVRSC